MTDLISRKKAIEALGERPGGKTDYDLGCRTQWDWDTEILRTMPSAEPEERTVKVVEAWGLSICDSCKKRVFENDNFCSHCGAKLDWS